MIGKLNIGTVWGGSAPFTLPADLGDKKIAMLAQSKKGKTYGLGCLLEELVKAQRPFIATDPANNLWGLRVLPDGRPSDLPVVVIGGDHADIPFEKDAGERMAEVLLATPVCAVLDLAFESLGSVRRFMTDFAGRLMQSKPEIPRVIVLEEAPVLIPQKARGPQMEVCKAAVAKLATIGGNFGYGVIPASQRAATIDKDVLSQCEALIVMGMTHGPDRQTVKEWIAAKGIGATVAQCFEELGSLKPGEAWYWNPGEDIFQKFTFRKRETLHPREMQKLGLRASAVQLGDVRAFVEKVKRDLARTVLTICDPPKNPKTTKALVNTAVHVGRQLHDQSTKIAELQRDLELKDASIARLSEELEAERGRVREAERRLAAVRTHLQPQYEVLSKIFTELGALPPGAAAADPGEYSKWLEKAPKDGIRVMLSHLIKKGEASRFQLSTIAGVNPVSTYYEYMRWLVSNGLAEKTKDGLKLRAI